MKTQSQTLTRSPHASLRRRFALGMALAIALAFAGSSAQAEGTRQKVIDFEDEYVEGVNKRPLDSVSQISEAERRRKNHLYRKRVGFRSETLETLRMMRFE